IVFGALRLQPPYGFAELVQSGWFGGAVSTGAVALHPQIPAQIAAKCDRRKFSRHDQTAPMKRWREVAGKKLSNAPQDAGGSTGTGACANCCVAMRTRGS